MNVQEEYVEEVVLYNILLSCRDNNSINLYGAAILNVTKLLSENRNYVVIKENKSKNILFTLNQ